MKKVLSVALSLCLLMGLCSCSSSSRYASEEEMKEALIGVWTTEDQTAQLTIGETSVNYRYRFLDGSSTDLDFDHNILEWDYKNGELTASQTHPITVSEDGSYILWQEKAFYPDGQLAIPEQHLLNIAVSTHFTLGGGMYNVNFGDVVNDTRAVSNCSVEYCRFEDADQEIQDRFSQVVDSVSGDKYLLTFTGSVNTNPQAADTVPNYLEEDVFAIYLIGLPYQDPNCFSWHSNTFRDMALLWQIYCNY